MDSSLVAKAYLLGHTCKECNDYTIDMNNEPYCDNITRNMDKMYRAKIPENNTCIFFKKSNHPGHISYDF